VEIAIVDARRSETLERLAEHLVARLAFVSTMFTLAR
jgi:hypothetical protein